MTPIYHFDIVQGSPEWHAARAGKWTASNAATIMGGLDTDGLAKLVKRVAWERVHGVIEGGFKSAAMERGHVVEPEARDWYAFTRLTQMQEVGLVDHASIANVAWSPDAITDNHGGAEIKCPLEMAWMEVKRTKKVPAEYRWQCRWAMWVGKLEWLDFVAYHPAAGGIIVPCEITQAEKDQMAERVALLEPKVAQWVSILNEGE
jgi:putative phage-type endonuclease